MRPRRWPKREHLPNWCATLADPRTLEDLDTPCLVLDRGRVAANAKRMRERLGALDVPLRLHVKTAKSVAVTDLVLGGIKAPIAVSTLKEAEEFFDAGYRDILYCVGIAAHKLPRAQALTARGATLTLLLDSVAAAEALAAFARDNRAAFSVLVEIDTDGHRAGLLPDDPALATIARTLAAAGCTVAGTLAHAGSSYACSDAAGIEVVAASERDKALAGARALRAAGCAAPVVSVGSTPTALYANALDGVSEVRAGVYVFFDLVMADVGACRVEDIALSVLATVIGARPDRGWTLIDAGWMALSRDRGTAKQALDQGYGVVCDLDGRPIDDLVVIDTNQEHGIIARRGGAGAAPLPVGTRVRILPNHACATAAQHPAYHVIEGNRSIQAHWTRFTGW